jgi:Tol biopolymer transport system component
MDLDTRAITRLTREPANGMHPSWSPDGARLAFMSWRNGRTEIFVMDADGQNQRPLVSTSSGGTIDPRWSPDGLRVVFVQVPESDATAAQDPASARAIYVVDVASGRVTRLSR